MMNESDVSSSSVDVDVAVVGAGPVGLTLAAFLGRSGHRVVVLERYPQLYGLPRAASFDGEIFRLFAELGIAENIRPSLHVQRAYQWSNADGEILLDQQSRDVGDSGWPDLVMFHQPLLEKELHALCASIPSIDIRLGATVTDVVPAGDFVVLESADTSMDESGAAVVSATAGRKNVTARFVVGCDGGNSSVRSTLGIGQDDLGFSEPWLVCDFKLRRRAEELGLPSALQVGDPAEPMTIFTTGAGHQRFCFMLDGTQAGHAPSEDETWRRVRRYLRPEDADIVRVATYTFRSVIAQRWRDGHILLAGDAAHQMPPFLGQGMCSGVRDAANLAFKLNRVLSGEQSADLLDTYQSEREPHVRGVMKTSMTLGRQHTLRDPELARQRDDMLRIRRDRLAAPERIQLPPLGPGMLGTGGGGLSTQGRVHDGTRTGLLDDLVGGGFRLLVRAEHLTEIDVANLQTLGVTVVGIGDVPGNGVVADLDGTIKRWLEHLGAAAVAERPDHYVFAAGPDAAEVARQLVTALRR